MSVQKDPLQQDGYFYRKEDLEPGNSAKSNKGNRKDKSSGDPPKEEKKLTVVFIAMLSKNFQKDFKEGTKIYIRGDGPIFNNWNNGPGETVQVERNNQQQFFLRCELNVPLNICDRKYAYKYVVVNGKGKPMYECLVEVESKAALWKNYGYINRCLHILKEHTVQNKILYKYDGFVYKNLGRTFLNQEQPKKDREQFFHLHFPLWRGFIVSSYDDKLELVEALERLHLLHLSQGVPEMLTSYGRYWSNEKVDLNQLDLGKIFVQILMQKIKNNHEIMESEDDVQNKVNALISTVVIVYVFCEYKVKLSDDDVVIMFKCLAIPPNENLCYKLMENVGNFDENMLRHFINNVLKFYEKQVKVIPLVLWLNALPLLHFLREDCKPFKVVDSSKALDSSNWKWWGMNGFPYRQLQGFTGREALEILQDLKKVFNMDPLIRRGFLLLCPLEIYHELLKTGLFSFLELCFTMRKLLSDRYLSSGNLVETLVKFLEELDKTLIHVCEPKDFPKAKFDETNSLLISLKTIAKNVKNYLPLHQVKFLCCLAKCTASAIHLQMAGLDIENEGGKKDDGRNWEKLYAQPQEMKKLLEPFNEQISTVKQFVHSQFYRMDLEDCGDNTWKNDLNVWNELLSFTASAFFNNLWFGTFKKQFSEMIHKVSPFRQIELFCLSNEQKCSQEVATCLSDAAFKAIEKVVKKVSPFEICILDVMKLKFNQVCSIDENDTLGRLQHTHI
ncbi:uncharacterized protein LOC124455046 isoform X2 [Xenia sp. Carnegie-2017]|uniref:uncharacterized protein LOC124455046 isoform X2 n=1 Tax=Xenia sp. Carnegie-2017 TaxID=2897299 RepID=UPI001F04BE61|nr:uncharacterized protein LOC124455046 isoform X2 [Xenia sp. Carnegie-2017]